MSLRCEDCWAKTTEDGRPGISVRDHCLNVGCVAEALIERLPVAVRDLLPPGAATLAALHDVGKVSPGFQQQCPAWREQNASWFRQRACENRHALISQEFLHRATDRRLRRAAEAIGAHHGLVQGPPQPGDTCGALWHEARMDLLREMEREFAPLPPDDLRDEAVEWLLAGLTAVADWIGSDKSRFSSEDRGPLAKAAQRRIAEKAVEELALAGAEATPGMAFETVFADCLKGGPSRPLQQRILDLEEPAPAVYVIEDAMGSGKTEAALWLTYRLMTGGFARGMAFALPTRVTSDRIHRRVKKYLERVSPANAPRLVHGQAWLRDMPRVERSGADKGYGDGEEEAEVTVRRWFASTRRGLLAPFSVGTVDQALLGVIAAKWFFVRQFALAGKVVVLDEVHSYDLYTGTLIRELVRRLRELRATPIILSATLTARQKAELLGERPPLASAEQPPYPAITVKRDGEPPRTFDVSLGAGAQPERIVRIVPVPVPDFEQVGDVIARAARLAEEGKNAVWIRNTVRHAQQTYRKLNGERCGTEYEIGLLHSRFPAFQRASRPDLNDLDALKRLNLHEERWLWTLGKPEPPRQDARPRASVLVSTQVVEQSVDIDADVLITDLAPTDMLLQRIGRLHRHERGDRGQPTVLLVVPQSLTDAAESLSVEQIRQALGAVGRVYDPYVLLRTWAQWRKRETIALPREIRNLLESTYAEAGNESEAWADLREELKRKKEAEEGRALNAVDVRGRPLGPDSEGFGTRLGGRQLLLLMLKCCSRQCDRDGNYEEIQLLSSKKLRLSHYGEFNPDAARHLHLNAAPVPAWWVPRAMRRSPPPALGQYFADDVVLCVWNEETGVVKLGLKNDVEADRMPRVCYCPHIGLWLERPPTREERRIEDADEDDDDIL